MDTRTNHLVSGEELARIFRETPELAGRYEALPSFLEGAARKVLHGRRAVKIARHSGGKLSKWAAAQRRTAAKNGAAKRTSRRAMEKKTRKSNRRGRG